MELARHRHSVIARHSVGQEDGVQDRKSGDLLATHGIDLQCRKEVVAHVKLHFRAGAYCREVKYVADRVGGGPHTERIRDVGLAPRTVGDGDSHIVTAPLGENIASS